MNEPLTGFSYLVEKEIKTVTGDTTVLNSTGNEIQEYELDNNIMQDIIKV